MPGFIQLQLLKTLRGIGVKYIHIIQKKPAEKNFKRG